MTFRGQELTHTRGKHSRYEEVQIILNKFASPQSSLNREHTGFPGSTPPSETAPDVGRDQVKITRLGIGLGSFRRCGRATEFSTQLNHAHHLPWSVQDSTSGGLAILISGDHHVSSFMENRREPLSRLQRL